MESSFPPSLNGRLTTNIPVDQKAGVPWLRIHDLRTAYGIKLAEQGVPMHSIQQVLGPSSVRITEEWYAKFSPESPRRYVLRVLEGGRNQKTA